MIDKISSIILVSMTTVDQAQVGAIAVQALRDFDLTKPVPSNLAKLIRRFL